MLKGNVEDHIMIVSRFAKIQRDRINCNLEWIIYLPLFVESAIPSRDNGLLCPLNMNHSMHTNNSN